MLHILLPEVVREPGKYVTRGGEVVTVDRVVRNRAYGTYSNGIAEWWSVRGGRVLPFSESQNDIVGKAKPVEPPTP